MDALVGSAHPPTDIGIRSTNKKNKMALTQQALPAKRLPLRAYVENGRERELTKAWSEGHTFFEWNRPERPSEKPIEEQSIEDLIGGDPMVLVDTIAAGLANMTAPDYGEPMSESRRSFLETGVGVLSLDIRTLFGSEGDKVSLIEIIPDDPERNDRMYRGTQYIQPDPSERERILREQQYAYSSRDVRVEVGATDSGSINFRQTGNGWQKFATQEKFLAFAKGLLRYYGMPKSLDEMQAKIDLLADAIDGDPLCVRYRNAFAPQERMRFFAQSDREWHGAYEATGPNPDGSPEHVVLATVMHGSTPLNTEDRKYGPWHGRARDMVDFELGTHLISDPALESLLGVTEWDEDGNPSK